MNCSNSALDWVAVFILVVILALSIYDGYQVSRALKRMTK